MKILKEEIIKLGTVFGVGMARISDRQLKDALCSQGDLSDLDISHKEFSRVVERMNIRNAWFNRSNLTKVNFSKYPVSGCEFRGTNLESASIRGTEITACDFREAKLLDAFLTNNRVERCDFSGADLRHCDFRNSTLKFCDFRDAKLQGANFRNCAFELVVFDRQWRLKNGMMVRA